MAGSIEDARPDLCGYTTHIRLEAQVIAGRPDHDHFRFRHSRRAIDYATSFAEHREPPGKTRKQPVKAVSKVIDAPADSCPACG